MVMPGKQSAMQKYCAQSVSCKRGNFDKGTVKIMWFIAVGK